MKQMDTTAFDQSYADYDAINVDDDQPPTDFEDSKPNSKGSGTQAPKPQAQSPKSNGVHPSSKETKVTKDLHGEEKKSDVTAIPDNANRDSFAGERRGSDDVQGRLSISTIAKMKVR